MAKARKTPTGAAQALIRGYLQQYPREAARLVDSLRPEDAIRYLRDEPSSTAAIVFLSLNPDFATELITEMEQDLFRVLFTTIDPARGAPLLARLDEDAAETRLAQMPEQVAREYRELLAYPQNTAGCLMDPRVTAFRADETVENALKRIRSVRNRRILDICVVDDDSTLLATLPLQEVAIAEPESRLGEIVQGQPVSTHVMSPREEVVELLEQKRLASLPVVDLDGKLLGIIRYDALVTAAKQEATEDLQAMFGAGRDERALSKASFAIRKRLPWLEINLATAFLAAAVVGLFEDTIARITALAVFLPVVAGQSGNTGSQALAVTMRGLALREVRTRHWFRIARKEVAVGFVNGVAVAVTTSLVAYLWMRSFGLSAVIGAAMVFSMVIAGLAGAVIPVILKAVGQDPAQSSSIILTTVTDVVGFMSFLGLATLLSTMLTIG
ncbi:MAG: magnesium transporter [Thermodesulfobacteriota bacterium]